MVGLPVAGVSTVFYAVLLIGMGATKLWRGVRERFIELQRGIENRALVVPAMDAGDEI
jgi:hypothetical protein